MGRLYVYFLAFLVMIPVLSEATTTCYTKTTNSTFMLRDLELDFFAEYVSGGGLSRLQTPQFVFYDSGRGARHVNVGTYQTQAAADSIFKLLRKEVSRELCEASLECEVRLFGQVINLKPSEYKLSIDRVMCLKK